MDQVDRGGNGDEEEEWYDKVCFDEHFVVVVYVYDHGSVIGVCGIKNKEKKGDEASVDHEAEYAC